MEDSIDVDDAWKKQYKLACLVNHASPQGTFKRLANGGITNCIPVGRSDYGITTPAEHSAISLQWITATFLTLFPNADSIQKTKVIHDWVEVIRELYFAAHDEIFAGIDDPIDYSSCGNTEIE